MKKDIDEFIEEITSNFSELFVETFFIRCLDNYDKNVLLKVIKDVKRKLNTKIDKKITEKFKTLNFKEK